TSLSGTQKPAPPSVHLSSEGFTVSGTLSCGTQRAAPPAAHAHFGSVFGSVGGCAGVFVHPWALDCGSLVPPLPFCFSPSRFDPAMSGAEHAAIKSAAAAA